MLILILYSTSQWHHIVHPGIKTMERLENSSNGVNCETLTLWPCVMYSAKLKLTLNRMQYP